MYELRISSHIYYYGDLIDLIPDLSGALKVFKKVKGLSLSNFDQNRKQLPFEFTSLKELCISDSLGLDRLLCALSFTELRKFHFYLRGNQFSEEFVITKILEAANTKL